jgi:hypothetical protein
MYNPMYMGLEARIRMFCVTGPEGDKASDISHAYLSALAQGSLGVRVLPLGPTDLSAIPPRKEVAGLVGPIFAKELPPDDYDPMARWRLHAQCFTNPIHSNYANVVCCPPGTLHGMNGTRRQFGMSKSDEVAMRAGYALCDLFTPSVPNVAITGSDPLPTEQELEALRKYDMVFCHKFSDVQVFQDLDVPVMFLGGTYDISPFINVELASRE